jgi:peptidyl-tRNA hydrolase, PTH2 family
MNVKQVIVVRKDLNMRKGKIAAQVAHAAMKVFLDRIKWTPIPPELESHYEATITNLTKEMIEWMVNSFTKVVVGVETEEELYAIANKAVEKKIPYSIIVDNGFTEFHGKKTTTCIAIGPDDSVKIDEITGNLELL